MRKNNLFSFTKQAYFSEKNLFFFLLLLSGCRLSESASNFPFKAREPFIAITPVMTNAINPIHSLWIDQKGNAEFLSHCYGERLGLYQKKLSSEERKYIEQALKKEMGNQKTIVGKMEGNEEVQPCTIFWYDDTIQRSLKSKNGIKLYREIRTQIGADSLKEWKYVNGMGITSFHLTRWNQDSSSYRIYYSSMGNNFMISHYNDQKKRTSLKITHPFSAYDVYKLFEKLDLLLMDTLHPTSPQRWFEFTGTMEVNPSPYGIKNRKLSEVKYKIQYNSSSLSLKKVNRTLENLVSQILADI